jgi:hypothetical protein
MRVLSVSTASSKSVKLDDPSCQTGAMSPARVQAFKRSFTALAGEKQSVFDATILIF